ncbi:MAG: hypothetical protein ACXADF_18455 [Candidatus Thorarchaeota archaeon]
MSKQSNVMYHLLVARHQRIFMIAALLRWNLPYVEAVYLHPHDADNIRIKVSDLIDDNDREQLRGVINGLIQNNKGKLIPFMTKLTRFLPQDRGIIYKASWHDMEVADI